MKRGGFYIIDWAGNLKFNGKTFDSFDSAAGYLYGKVKEEDLEEFYIECKACNGDKQI